MELNTILCVTAVILVLAFMAGSLWLTRPRCPECKSLRINEISKEPLSMRGVDISPGEGGYASTQIIYEVKYRCSECQSRWTVTKSETK
jgi:hypothetical protein